MSEPDYATFYRTLATLRVRLRDPEPFDEVERECFVEILNAFEEMMNGTRTLMERVDKLDRAARAVLEGRPPAT